MREVNRRSGSRKGNGNGKTEETVKITRRLFVCLGVLILAALMAAPLALATESANIIQPQHAPASAEDGWQSANCTADQPAKGEFCSPQTPNLYFKQAGGHPNPQPSGVLFHMSPKR